MRVRRSFAAALFVALVSTGARAQGGSFALKPVLSGLQNPVFVTNARDGSHRLFVVELPGRIQVLQPGAAAPTVFLDISDRVLYSAEKGLLGLAFHPQFSTNRRFFVNYTRKPDGASVIAEYRASQTNPNAAETEEKVILVIPQPYGDHNGGTVEFGPDGLLYVAMGDGGSANDPDNRAQNVEELLGKMLRINVDQPNGSVPYSAPPDNPFFGATPGRDEIYAVGLRNPYRFSFDRATGLLYLADVGQVTREEIDIIERGGNYGWRVFEGTLCTNRGPAECVAANYKMPVAEYDHTGGRCSVTGGNVYRGALSTLPAGAYVYGDFCTGEIFLLQGTAQTLLADTPYFITSFGEDEAGEIYVAGYSSGTVHRIGTTCSYSVSPAPPQDFPASGGQGSFQINTSAGCPWTATSLSPWITITQGAGTGSGTVNFTVAANTGAARAGRILHTENSLYSITQQAAPATLQFSAATFQAGEGEGRALVTVTRAGDPSAAVSVEVSTADDLSPVRCDAVTGVAYPRCDYATTVERVTFTAGDSQPKTVSVPLIDDAHVEGGETLQLKLAAPSGAALGAQQSATLAVTDNDSPGQPNPIRQTTFFVRMHYLDFLSREPEAGEPWSATLDNCPAGDTRCDRVQVSANFFLSEEFRIKGFFVFRFYRAALGRLPTYSEIIPDMRGVTGTTPAEVYAKKAAFTDAFVGRQEFRNRFDALTNQQFVDALLTPYSLQQITTPDPASPDTGAKVTLTRAELVNRLNAATLTRARVVRAVADSDEVAAAEANRAFVAMQYFGYLRRDPEPEGFNNWLNTINADPANYRAMVNGFMNSNEYRLRFGDPER